MQSTSCSILACQISVPLTRSRIQREQHVTQLVHKIEHQLAGQDCDLVVLPELSTVEYSRESFGNLDEMGETLTGDSVEQFRQLARDCNVSLLFGLPRLDGQRRYISQVYIDAEGGLSHYDKIHVCQYGASMEKEYFDRGSKLMVFDLAGFRFGVMICYDIRIPEQCREMVVGHHVEVILHCGAYFRDESFASWASFVTTRAMENQVYFLSLNRAGTDYGASKFSGPWIDENTPLIDFHPHKEEFRFFRLDKAHLHDVRASYTFLKDRLPEYHAI